ncbi:MAG: NAD(+) synthase [Lachnospiraceae bacterium]|nr:NAD(+) synthase [Lachnospiraceae bacterium]
MKDGYIKVAAATPSVKVADCEYNVKSIKKLMKEASDKGAKVTVFPELCITAYSCGELFLQERLLEAARCGLLDIVKESKKYDGIFFVGLPLDVKGALLNVACAISCGEILGFIPKTYLPTYGEFYESRHFVSGRDYDMWIDVEGHKDIPLTTKLIFKATNMPKLVIGAEICEDLWTMCPPSTDAAKAGATLIVNLSASDAITGKSSYRRELVKNQSARLMAGYVYASAGEGESTMDVVYSGHNLIAENGTILKESKQFTTGLIISEIDVDKMTAERRRINTYENDKEDFYTVREFLIKDEETCLTRYIDPAPFVPSSDMERKARCEEIFDIQANGLKKRLEHTNSKTAVIGISGGLDSTLALLVTVRAFDLIKKPHKDIIAVTMPGFGTTDRTYENALALVKGLDATLLEISIKDSVNQHFMDIGHDPSVHDVTYENCQARERTQILMDLSNKYLGMVIGTGDMSELALGWATYNGDHMSMYAVNTSIPKTLVRHLVRYYADELADKKLSKVLLDVLDTPVSPELLPPENGKIAQKTEELVGPYELHDFFMYYVLRFGFMPKKIYRLAKSAFNGKYSEEVILKWMKVFYRRFFAQQFKRSCLPDGPKVGSVAVSPRGDLRMPSDASASLWLNELEDI